MQTWQRNSGCSDKLTVHAKNSLEQLWSSAALNVQKSKWANKHIAKENKDSSIAKNQGCWDICTLLASAFAKHTKLHKHKMHWS
jgi:hypothetical protein